MKKGQKARNSDGTFRNVRRPKEIKPRSLRARWVEAEGLRLKRSGVSYEAAAQHITDVGRGKVTPIVPLPEGIVFGQNYSIGARSLAEAVTKVLNALPNEEAEHYRKLQVERCEDMFLALQPRIQAGDSQAVNSGLKALVHEVEILGIKAPLKLEQTARYGEQVVPLLIKPALSERERFEEAIEVIKILWECGGLGNREDLVKTLFNSGALGSRKELAMILLESGALGSSEELAAAATNGKLIGPGQR